MSKPESRICMGCGNPMKVVAPAPNFENKPANWRHECTNCNTVKREGEYNE